MPKFFWNKVFLKNSHLCSTRLQNRNLYWIFLDEVSSDQSGGILSPFMSTTCLICNHFPVPVHNWIKQQICISSERFNFSIGIKWDECLLIIGTNTVECNNLSMPWIPASGTTSLIHTHTCVYIYIYIYIYSVIIIHAIMRPPTVEPSFLMIPIMQDPGWHLSIKMPSYQYQDPHNENKEKGKMVMISVQGPDD